MSDTITIKKDSLWKYSTFILAALLIVVLFVSFGKNDSVTGNVVANDPTPVPGNTQPAQVSADDDPFLLS